jgi:hypothetical protein
MKIFYLAILVQVIWNVNYCYIKKARNFNIVCNHNCGSLFTTLENIFHELFILKLSYIEFT